MSRARLRAGLKKNKDALLLFSIPVAMLLLGLAFVQIPRLLASPDYDFIYFKCKTGYSYCSREYGYDVSDSGIISVDYDGSGDHQFATSRTSSSLSTPTEPAGLFIYDVSEGTSTKITLQEANRDYQLSAAEIAPDGYTLQRSERGSRGFLFSYRSYGSSGWELADGVWKKDINLTNEPIFLSWVIEGGAQDE